MTVLICVACGLVMGIIGWRSGYHAGVSDGQDGYSCCFPWSKVKEIKQ